MEDFLTHSSSEYKFTLDEFDGPLDLLLELIRVNKLDVKTIRISQITDQYLKIVYDMEFFDMDKASDFVQLAATLLSIKAKSLVPKDEFEFDDYEFDDYEDDLRRKLIEYSMFKEQSLKLKQEETLYRQYRSPEYTEDDVRLSFINFNIDKLIDNYVYCLSKAPSSKKEKIAKTIERDMFKVSDKIYQISRLLKSNETIDFYSLFDKNSTRNEVITIFLAILELLKVQYVIANQKEDYKNIEIKINENVTEEDISKFDFSDWENHSTKTDEDSEDGK